MRDRDRSNTRAIVEGLLSVVAAVGKVFLVVVVGAVVIAIRGAFGATGR